MQPISLGTAAVMPSEISNEISGDVSGEMPEYVTLITPQLSAPIHQHIFNVRMK